MDFQDKQRNGDSEYAIAKSLYASGFFDFLIYFLFVHVLIVSRL